MRDDPDERTRLWVRSKDYFINQGSIFTPDARIRINFVPIVLAVILPWILYVVLLTTSIFRFRHDHESVQSAFYWSIVGGLFCFFVYRLTKEIHTVEARWTRAGFCFTIIAVIAALISSFSIYSAYLQRYYDTMDLRTYPLVDVASTHGKDVMDAGVM